MNKNRNTCIELFNVVLNLLARSGHDWKDNVLEEIVKLIDNNVLLSNEQIDIITCNFCNNDKNTINNLRFGGISSRLSALVNNLEKLFMEIFYLLKKSL